MWNFEYIFKGLGVNSKSEVPNLARKKKNLTGMQPDWIVPLREPDLTAVKPKLKLDCSM